MSGKSKHFSVLSNFSAITKNRGQKHNRQHSRALLYETSFIKKKEEKVGSGKKNGNGKMARGTKGRASKRISSPFPAFSELLIISLSPVSILFTLKRETHTHRDR